MAQLNEIGGSEIFQRVKYALHCHKRGDLSKANKAMTSDLVINPDPSHLPFFAGKLTRDPFREKDLDFGRFLISADYAPVKFADSAARGGDHGERVLRGSRDAMSTGKRPPAAGEDLRRSPRVAGGAARTPATAQASAWMGRRGRGEVLRTRCSEWAVWLLAEPLLGLHCAFLRRDPSRSHCNVAQALLVSDLIDVVCRVM